MTDHDVPTLLTVGDVARYRGVTEAAASAFCRGLEVGPVRSWLGGRTPRTFVVSGVDLQF